MARHIGSMENAASLTAAGLMVAMPALAQEPSAPRGVVRTITLAQFQSAGRARLMKADADRDSRLTKAEWAARRQAARTATKGDPAHVFDMLDANRDGALDSGELDAVLAKRFARMDADRNGSLTAEERRAARGRMDD